LILVAGVLLGPVIAYVANRPKGAIYLGALGVTILVWYFAIQWVRSFEESEARHQAPSTSGQAPHAGSPPPTTNQEPEEERPATRHPNPQEKKSPPKSQGKNSAQPAGEIDRAGTAKGAVAPAEPKTFREKIENYTFSLGAGGVSVTYTIDALRTGPKAPFEFGDYHPVWVYLENEKLFANCDFYDGPGLSPVEVRKNEFVVRPANWDRNFSSTALEIVDSHENPVFQFIYKTPSHIVVNGIFPYPGRVVLANENGMLIRPTVPANFRLRRIFKYPSWKYPGQYEERSD